MSASARRADSTAFALSEINARDDALRFVTAAFVRDENNVSRQVWGGAAGGGGGGTGDGPNDFAAEATPPYVSGSISQGTARPAMTNATTVTTMRGVAPFGFAWGAQTGWTISQPTGSTTYFTANAVSPGADQTADFVCTVTDANGSTATATVTAFASNNYGGNQ